MKVGEKHNMATLYVTTVDKTNVYNKPSTSSGSKILQTIGKGQEVNIFEEKSSGSIRMGKISSSESRWVSMMFLRKVKSSSSSSSSSSKETGVSQENKDKAKNDTITGNSISDYVALYNKYLHAYGCPPRFTDEVDPRYNSSSGNKIGRAMAKTWFSEPSILSLCPGKVDYLPGFGKKKKANKLFSMIKNSLSDELASKIKSEKSDLNGQLYGFKSAYTEYMNVVNLLARTAADFIGVGNVDNIIEGSSIPLKNFDYGHYSDGKTKGKYGIFDEVSYGLNTAVSDGSYIHFFVNYSGGVNGTDNFSNASESSYLEDAFNGSEVSKMVRNLNFLFGTNAEAAEQDISNIIKEATDSSQLLGSLASVGANYLKGGKLVFPQMLSTSTYSKSIQCELTFSSIYGDKRSIFKYVTLPAIHLLALATPKQISNNMYTYPFLVRAYQKGNINTDLAFISNLDLVRGGSDNTSWTVDGLATEITARFTITPLYSNMMVTSARNPLLFMHNTALMEYLGTMCGLDLKANNLDVKVKIAKNLIYNKVFDTPTVLARGITDSWLVNDIKKFTQIIN